MEFFTYESGGFTCNQTSGGDEYSSWYSKRCSVTYNGGELYLSGVYSSYSGSGMIDQVSLDSGYDKNNTHNHCLHHVQPNYGPTSYPAYCISSSN